MSELLLAEKELFMLIESTFEYAQNKTKLPSVMDSWDTICRLCVNN